MAIIAHSEFNHKLSCQDPKRRLGNLEQELIAAARGSKVEVSVADIRRRSLLTVLRERTRHNSEGQ